MRQGSTVLMLEHPEVRRVWHDHEPFACRVICAKGRAVWRRTWRTAWYGVRPSRGGGIHVLEHPNAILKRPEASRAAEEEKLVRSLVVAIVPVGNAARRGRRLGNGLPGGNANAVRIGENPEVALERAAASENCHRVRNGVVCRDKNLT